VPESTRGKRAWRQAATQVEEYRTVYGVSDPERALGPIPQQARQRADWQRAQVAIERVHHKQRAAERDHRGVSLQQHRRRRGGPAEPPERQQSPARARPERDTPRGRQGPERAAG
jgi:hypothetical protein